MSWDTEHHEVPGRVSEAVAARVDGALEPESIDPLDDTKELLDPLFSAVDRALTQIVERCGQPQGSEAALRGWANLAVVAHDDQGARPRSESCARCGARTNKTQRFLWTLAQRTTHGRSTAGDLAVTTIDEGVMFTIDVDAQTLLGVLRDLATLGDWLVQECSERGLHFASSNVNFTADAWRL